MERIGIYGGTFNPPHAGHVRAARQAMEALQLTKLIVIPTRATPNKALPEGSPTPEQRMEMARLAFAGDDRIHVSDLEILRPGTSYTWQTVEQLREHNPGAELILMMGTDMFLSFEQWVKPQQIMEHADLAVLYRGDAGEEEAVLCQKQKLEARGERVHVVNNIVTDISSTDLRRLLTFDCADPFLPEGVGAYIRQHRLYQSGKSLRNLPMEELEPVVVELMNPNRVKHILGVRDTAVKLAQRWGADVTDAARAGLLHDVTKALDGPLQLTLCHEYGTILSDFGAHHPKTLHALTGALVAERIFGENEAVISAIRNHTTGKANMTLLEKIVYVADYMEPNRDFPGVEKLRELAFTDLDGALRLGLQMTIENLRERGLEISPESRDALNYLENQENCPSKKG